MKKPVIRLNKFYLLLTTILFIAEVFIALFLHDRFIRPYVGDFLVVILIYCFVKSFFNTPVLQTALAVLLFAYGVETLQYFQLVNRLGLSHSRLARIILGSAFEWIDLLVYTLGILTVLWIEHLRSVNNK